MTMTKAEREELEALRAFKKAKANAKEYDNTNQGAVWYKTTKNKKVMFFARIDIDGEFYYFDGWKAKGGLDTKAPVLNLERISEEDMVKRNLVANPTNPL